MKPFILFGVDHLTAMTSVLLFSMALIWIGRKSGCGGPGRRGADRMITILLLSVLIGAILFRHLYRLENGLWSVLYDLPLQLCDWAAISVIFALCFPRSRIREVAYCWGVGGGAQALLTPELAYGFPHHKFLEFFISHAALVSGALYVTIGRNSPFSPGAIKRVFLISQFFLGTAFVVNWILGSNYGYVSRKPEAVSLLDFMGPWPWYLIGMELFGLVTVFLLVALLKLTTSAGKP